MIKNKTEGKETKLLVLLFIKFFLKKSIESLANIISMNFMSRP